MAINNRPSKEAVKELKVFLENKQYDLQEEVSLCLSDLPKDHMSKGSNGKIYINLTIGIRKDPDQWGRDLKVYVTPTRQDKEAHAPKNYVGGGNMIIFAVAGSAPVTDADMSAILPAPDVDEKDNLPF